MFYMVDFPLSVQFCTMLFYWHAKHNISPFHNSFKHSPVVEWTHNFVVFLKRLFFGTLLIFSKYNRLCLESKILGRLRSLWCAHVAVMCSLEREKVCRLRKSCTGGAGFLLVDSSASLSAFPCQYTLSQTSLLKASEEVLCPVPIFVFFIRVVWGLL